MGAGAVGASLIGLLPSKSRELGPVCAVSYRVASRTANTLRAGYPVRTVNELHSVPCVLFHSPPEHMTSLLGILEEAGIEWAGKSIVFCDCVVSRVVRQRFQSKGASTTVARQCGIPGRLIVEGHDGAALQTVHRIARELRWKAVQILPGSADLFDAAVTLSGAAITPLIDQAAALLRHAGIRDVEAARMASALFERTALDYAHSGKQSWAWYARKPQLEGLRSQLAAAGPHLEPVLRQLLQFSFETFRKHREFGAELPRTNSEANEE
jgi:hypothetical protein